MSDVVPARFAVTVQELGRSLGFNWERSEAELIADQLTGIQEGLRKAAARLGPADEPATVFEAVE